MGSNKKTPIDMVKDKVDILSTSIEVINQKLAQQLNPVVKADPVLLKEISMIDNKLGFLYNTVKKLNDVEPKEEDPKKASSIMDLKNKIESMETKVESSHHTTTQLLDLQKQQVRVLTEQNQAINQHITDINNRITDLVEANKELMKTLASSIRGDLQTAKSETKKVKEKINHKKK